MTGVQTCALPIYQKWGKYHKLVCYSQYKHGKEYMIKDPNCNNAKVRADEVEAEVEDYFKWFAIKAEKGQKIESKVAIIEDSIKKTNAKIKKYYSLYAERESDNLFELIQEEEERLSGLKDELQSERSSEKSIGQDRIEEINRAADLWDKFNSQEKNKILKKCVDRVVITGKDVEMHFTI